MGTLFHNFFQALVILLLLARIISSSGNFDHQRKLFRENSPTLWILTEGWQHWSFLQQSLLQSVQHSSHKRLRFCSVWTVFFSVPKQGRETVDMRLQLSHCSPNDMCLKFTVQSIEALRFSKCCFVFTPRQGTMLVAVIELSLTSILLFLLLVAAMNTQDIATLAASNSDDIENNWTSVFGERFSLSLYYNKNERKMLTGQHLARIMVTLTYGGVVLSMIHILSCLMLLYGALYDIPHFLLPWLSTVLFSLVISSLILITLLFFLHQRCILSLYVVLTVVLVLEIYAWLVVFSYYRDVSASNNLYDDITDFSASFRVSNETKNGVFDF